MKEDLATCLLEYPQLIVEANKKVLAMTEKSEQQRAVVKELVLQANFKVSANPALKNEMQRKTELDTYLKADGEYQDAVTNDQQLNYNLALERIGLEYLNNMFRAYLAIAKMEE